MSSSTDPARTSLAAFSLVELMVVVAIIAIIAGFVVPATTDVVQSSRLSNCAVNLMNQLNAARMLAIRMNQPVEMHFYQYADTEDPGQTPAYHGCDMWVNGIRYSTMTTFETGVVLSAMKDASGQSWSSILDPSVNTLGTNQPLPTGIKIGRAASSPAPTYSYFQFRPDGSTNLSGSQQWTLTLLMEKDSARTVLPSNFVSIVLDPLTGGVRMLSP
ncbi:Verru_Chthon cassette protein D [Chthoniobacter flavus]|nr:Verru_Chthon cassette protein D [Chthoniobacter flavus]